MPSVPFKRLEQHLQGDVVRDISDRSRQKNMECNHIAAGDFQLHMLRDNLQRQKPEHRQQAQREEQQFQSREHAPFRPVTAIPHGRP